MAVCIAGTRDAPGPLFLAPCLLEGAPRTLSGRIAGNTFCKSTVDPGLIRARYAHTPAHDSILAYALALLESRPVTTFLGQLKTLLTGPELPVTKDIVVPWDIAYFFDHLRPQFPASSADFLTALVAAMNDRVNLATLGEFPEWRDHPPIPLDVLWPTE